MNREKFLPLRNHHFPLFDLENCLISNCTSTFDVFIQIWRPVGQWVRIGCFVALNSVNNGHKRIWLNEKNACVRYPPPLLPIYKMMTGVVAVNPHWWKNSHDKPNWTMNWSFWLFHEDIIVRDGSLSVCLSFVIIDSTSYNIKHPRFCTYNFRRTRTLIFFIQISQFPTRDLDWMAENERSHVYVSVCLKTGWWSPNTHAHSNRLFVFDLPHSVCVQQSFFLSIV